jgi:cyclase
MLKKRIIPILQYENQTAIKTKFFKKNRNVGNLLQYVKVFNRRKSDELGIINLSNKFNHNESKIYDINYLKSISSECDMPLCVGGSLNNISEIEELLKIGCDKVIIGKAFFSNKKFIKNIIKSFGSQIVIAAVDINKSNDQYFLNHNQSKNYIDHINLLQDYGVGELLISSVHKEGTMGGYDIEFLEKIYNKLKTPVLINGGAKNFSDFQKVLEIDIVQGACASSIFLFTEATPNSIKKELNKNANIRK